MKTEDINRSGKDKNKVAKENLKPQKKLRIVFFGTPEFAVESLSRIADDGYDIAAVVTMPDKLAGRGHKLIESDVKRYAVSHGLKVLQPTNLKSPEFIEELRGLAADLFVVIAFRMLPEAVWKMPALGTFNLHASLLPKYRGAAPINWAVINGDNETGVTTFFLKHEIDTGDIIEQRKVAINPEENVGDVHDKLMSLGAEMVSHTISQIESGDVHPTPQPEGKATAAPKIFKETCRIDWSKPATEIHNLIRGLSPYPGAWTTVESGDGKSNELDIKIFASAPLNGKSVLPEVQDERIGEVIEDKNRLLIVTGKGILEILSLQPSGKKRMNASEFKRGYSIKKLR